MHEIIIRALVLVAALVASPALAHNLILEAYPFGEEIAGEAFFSDGVLVDAAVIEVFDAEGNKIGEAVTDAYGSFTYAPTEAGEHRFRVDAGSGHVAEVVIPAADIAPLIGAEAPRPEAAASTEAGPVAGSQIEAIVAQEMLSLKSQLDAYRARNDFLNLIAAIGILAGIAGLVMFVIGSRIAPSGPRNRVPLRRTEPSRAEFQEAAE